MPIVKAEPIVDLSKKTILVWGQPKIGKSTFAASFPEAVFLATEAGLNDLACSRWSYNNERYVLQNWNDVLMATAEVIQDGAKTIILDTADNAYFMCEQHICAKHGVEYKTDDKLSYGKGSALITGEFRRYLTKLSSVGIGIILTSHATTETRETRTGSTSVSVPTLPDKIRPIITGMMDMILYCTTRVVVSEAGRTIERVIYTKPDPTFEAGDRSGRLPDMLPLDYAAFAAAFAAGGK
jgi:hypothetical protein